MLLALIVGQIGLHATMAGVRMAAPLQALREGHSAWSVGVLLALYAAAPVLLSMHAGRMADRHRLPPAGAHRRRPVAVRRAAGGGLAPSSASAARFPLLCASAVFVGSGANMGLIVIQRRAGQAVSTSTERMRMFSWLGIAPSLSNVVGPVAAGFMIDAGGFRAAYGLMLAAAAAHLVVHAAAPARARRTLRAPPRREAQSSWTLLAAPGLKRLLVVNWVLSACWDVHMFAVPILGFERGFNATTIGLILGTFTLAVSGVRLLIPLWAHRISEIARAARRDGRHGHRLRPVPAGPVALADGRLRGAAGPDARLGAADDHVHAAPADARRAATARPLPCARW